MITGRRARDVIGYIGGLRGLGVAGVWHCLCTMHYALCTMHYSAIHMHQSHNYTRASLRNLAGLGQRTARSNQHF